MDGRIDGELHTSILQDKFPATVTFCVHIGIEATNKAWTEAFNSLSHLEELVIDNTQPSSIGVKALQSLVVLPVGANNVSATAAPREWNTPACPLLKLLSLQYCHWLQTSEKFDLIPVLKSIIQSRQQSKCSLQSFQIWGCISQRCPLELIDGSDKELELYGFKWSAFDTLHLCTLCLC